jgi:hypothetical protein
VLYKSLVALAAGAIAVTAFSMSSAHADPKKARQLVAQPSLDGRVTGQPRTCGYDYFVYDAKGVPTGPYCH